LVLVVLIRGYRLTLSGLLGGQCRFHPSCSEYAEQAVRSVGAVRGAGLAMWRILRCSPLSRGGIDHPPGSPVYDDDIHRGGVVS
jgi:putative membrane protein insertion efficiency factor